jgi:hypothetical protein
MYVWGQTSKRRRGPWGLCLTYFSQSCREILYSDNGPRGKLFLTQCIDNAIRTFRTFVASSLTV